MIHITYNEARHNDSVNFINNHEERMFLYEKVLLSKKISIIRNATNLNLSIHVKQVCFFCNTLSSILIQSPSKKLLICLCSPSYLNRAYVINDNPIMAKDVLILFNRKLCSLRKLFFILSTIKIVIY